MYLGIPLDCTLFFPLRIRRETPFQDTPYTWLPTMLTVKKLAIHGRIPSPMRMYASQPLIAAECDSLSHSIGI